MLEDIVIKIIYLDTVKGINRHGFKAKARQLRKELAKLMDQEMMFVEGWYLHKQHHQWGDTVAFFTPDKWKNRQDYFNKNKPRKLSNREREIKKLEKYKSIQDKETEGNRMRMEARKLL